MTMNLIDWVSFVFTILIQYFLFSRGQKFIRIFINFSALFVYAGLLLFFVVAWIVPTFGLFRLAQAVTPKMKGRQAGNIIVTSATSAVRGNKGQHSHAAAMGGRRMLCQSLNAEFSKDGIHVAHVIIDGAVDAPDTLGKMLGPELFEKFKEQKGQNGMILPEEVAETYLFVAKQKKSTWTHEIDIRAFSDQAWWNH